MTTPLMKVGDLARKTGKSVRALRLYEERGLLSPARRTSGGFRLYATDSVARVYWIAKLQTMGFSLNQIGGLLGMVEESKTAPEAMESVRELFRARLAETREQVAKLMELERDLSESLAYLEGCRTCSEESAAEACASCDTEHSERHPGPAPTLVAGIHRGPGTGNPPADGSDEVTA